MSKAYLLPNPCKGCEKRVVGCHGVCKEHKEWKDSGVEIKEPFIDYDTNRKRRQRKR